jgi:hypothetical protein
MNRGQLFVKATEDASLEMSTTPGTPGNTDLISLFQTDCVALSVVRTFGVKAVRDAIVAVTDVAWADL